MKFLTDRQEIAAAMNFNKYPVLYIDLDNKPYEKSFPDSDFAKGCKCRIAWDRPELRFKDMTCRCELNYSEGKFSLHQGADVLKNDFGRSDVIEMAEWAMTPLLHSGDTVVVVEDYTKQKKCIVRMMQVGRIDIHCSTVARLNDIV